MGLFVARASAGAVVNSNPSISLAVLPRKHCLSPTVDHVSHLTAVTVV